MLYNKFETLPLTDVLLLTDTNINHWAVYFYRGTLWI